MAFRFRHFSIEDTNSTMKVGTDAMLLGAWTGSSSDTSILDIGTGCGVLALMLAQGSEASIDAIDIHPPSVEEASRNFGSSPWKDRLHPYLISLQEHAGICGKTYDLIITNPPFFSSSLKPASEVKKIAKHDDSLSFEELIHHSLRLMHHTSRFSLILPVNESGQFEKLAKKSGLFPSRRMNVLPGPESPPHRIMTEYNLTGRKVSEEFLKIMNSKGKFTQEYLSLTQNFHHFRGIGT